MEVTPADMYKTMRRHPALFRPGGWPDGWLHSDACAAAKAAAVGDAAALAEVLTEEAPGVYSMELVTQAFATALLDELDGYRASGLPIRRPNSMNNYGIIVNEIGLRPALDWLQQEVLQPVAAHLFPEEGAVLDGHHSFMVQYKADEDPGLDMHTDDSDVTVNVCLGREFEGAGWTFCGAQGSGAHRKFSYAYKHKVGRAVLHLGAQRHGADDIRQGRWNDQQHVLVLNEPVLYVEPDRRPSVVPET